MEKVVYGRSIRSLPKVRTGCANCRQRKIKCDEKWPKCGRCVNGGFASCNVLMVHFIHACQNLVPYSRRLNPSETRGINFLDLELMHHWTTSTCEMLSSPSSLIPFWKKNVVKIGLSCDFVMQALLSLAALHLADQNPHRKPELLPCALSLYSNAAAGARRSMEIEQKDADIIDNLFMFSVLTMFYGKSGTGLSQVVVFSNYDSVALSATEHPNDVLFNSTSSESQPGLNWIVLFLGSSHLGRDSESVFATDRLLHPLVSYMMGIAVRHDDLRCEEGWNSNMGRGLMPKEFPTKAVRELMVTFEVMSICKETRNVLHAFYWMDVCSEDFARWLEDPYPSQEMLVVLNYFYLLLERLPRVWLLKNWVGGLGTFQLLDKEHQAWVIPPAEWS